MAFMSPYSAALAQRDREERLHRAHLAREARRHVASTSAAPADRMSPEHPGEGRPRRFFAWAR
jgi:hypothetical protein